MLDRRDIKTKARAHLRRHYVLLCVLCAVSIFLGTEFADVTGNAQSWYDILTGQETELDLEGFFEEPEEAAEEAEGRLFENYSKENLTARREEAAAQMRQMQAAPAEHTALGHSRGVLASLVNSVDSGHLYAMGATAISSIVRSERATGILLIGGSMLFYAAVWVFIRNMHAAILRRAFLETRIYSRMPLGHLLHFKMVGRWCRVALTLLAKEILERLWWLTIVGGVIKHYSYYLVPFIAAENPDVKPFEALTLSRRLMNGHKWECFKLNLSFVGWRILGFFTFGAADVLWSIPYGVAADAELYTRLRAKAKDDGMPGAERLDDDALFVHPDGETLRRHYADIVLKEDLTDNPIVDLTPVQRFFAVNFGIWLGSSIDKRIYSRQAGLRHQARVGRMELDGLAYPQRVNRLWRREAAALTGKVSYLMPATVWSLFLVFMLFSMVGWIWEVSLHMITHGTFVNRGILHGPWLPIYGGGVVLIAVLLFRLREKPALEAAAIIVLCGVVEYLTSYLMERANGMRWWDYSGYFLNLNGRICCEGLAVFAVGGMIAVYLLVPLLDLMMERISTKVLIPVCAVLAFCFFGDLGYSRRVPNMGEGITESGPAQAALAEAQPARYRVWMTSENG